MADTATKETPQTRATLKYLRTSAYKVREVLDLIRGLDVDDARHVLQFNERGPAREVLKVLNSAVANADNLLNIPADELKVAVAYADEGPTMKRWRPRARGRATRIRKRTCHITIIVSRLSGEELARLRETESTSGRAATAARRERRVARSREKAERKAAARHEHEHDHDGEHDHDHDEEHGHDGEAAAELEAEVAGAEVHADEPAEGADEVEATTDSDTEAVAETDTDADTDTDGASDEGDADETEGDSA